jgi:probable F420-dependent oxidoreductase
MLILSENWTMCDARNTRDLVDWAVMAEEAGVDAVMISEHIVLGPSAGNVGRMSNPRMYALPGNQDPATPWPSSLMLLAAIAARTTKLRLFAGAIIAPLRHPIGLAKDLATLDLISQGRLIVQPTVSWHEDEYKALGIPFQERGNLLDEHLAIWKLLWTQTPAAYHGRYFEFEDVYCEPKPYRSGGPTLWFGGQSLTPRVVRRLVEYGSGFHPLGPPTQQDMQRLDSALREAGRKMDEIELVGGIRATFTSDDQPADFEHALESIPPQLRAGFTTICIKPNQFIDDATQLRLFFQRVVKAFEELTHHD